MEFSKHQLVELLRSQGEGDKAAQAQDQLPDQVDPRPTPTCSTTSASTRRTCSASSVAASAGWAADVPDQRLPWCRPLE